MTMKGFGIAAVLACCILMAAACAKGEGDAMGSMAGTPGGADAGVYYIDATLGDDSYEGTDPGRPWRSLDKVNATEFQPGDRILFKSGEHWTGQLKPQGSGALGRPIVVDAYGEGPKPLIDGDGVLAGVVVLHNQEYWELNNLEIMNDAPTPGDRRGVEVTASNYGTVHHIHIKNMVIHDIKGIIGHEMDAKRTAGIYIGTLDDRLVPTRFHNILIDGNTIYNVENQGIVTTNEVKVSDYPGTEDWNRRRFTEVAIRNNTIYNISKNAMIVRLTDGGVVEYNVAYNTATAITGNTYFSRSARGTVFQYNEGYLNMSPGRDGSMYDADLQSPETVWQYSYSHDNAHGLMWFCTDIRDTDIIVRYNISQNDRGILINVNYDMGSAYIYNNVFYIGSHLSPTIIEETSRTQQYAFYNNIIYNNSPTAMYKMNDTNTIRSIENNVFFGFHPPNEPDDPFKITEDPMLAAPGSGGIGLDTLEGYKLLRGSPAIHTGKVIADNGGQDFWGQRVSADAPPNRGVYNGPGRVDPSAAPVLLSAVPGDKQIALQWSKVTNAAGYKVMIGEESGKYDRAIDVGDTQSYVAEELTNGVTYYFAVLAYSQQPNPPAACDKRTLPHCRMSNERQAAPVLSLAVAEDAYVRGGSYANANYGGDAQLFVKRGTDPSFFREAFLKMDLTELSSLNTELASATLHFHINSNESNAALHLFGLSNAAWSEADVTWNTKPNDPDRLELAQLPVTGTGWYQVDVTDYVKSRLTAGEATFQFTDEQARNKQAVLSSKESGSGAYLLIEPGSASGR